MKTFSCTLLVCIALFSYSCSDETSGCPDNFNGAELQAFNYTKGQTLQFVSPSCQDTILLTITERKISEGPTGKYPETLNGRCASKFYVKGLLTSPFSSYNCDSVQEPIDFYFQRVTREEDYTFVNKGYGIIYDIVAPLNDVAVGDLMIGDRLYKSVRRNTAEAKSGCTLKYAYYSMAAGYIKLVFLQNNEEVSYEKIQ